MGLKKNMRAMDGFQKTDPSNTAPPPKTFRDEMSIIVGFEVLTAVGMKMAVFWVVAPCSLVEV
jgi:hypothetical protein